MTRRARRAHRSSLAGLAAVVTWPWEHPAAWICGYYIGSIAVIVAVRIAQGHLY